MKIVFSGIELKSTIKKKNYGQQVKEDVTT